MCDNNNENKKDIVIGLQKKHRGCSIISAGFMQWRKILFKGNSRLRVITLVVSKYQIYWTDPEMAYQDNVKL